jgi:hypothetical protein
MKCSTQVALGWALLFLLAGCDRELHVLACGKTIDYWIEKCRDADPKVRREAVAKLGNFGGAEPSVVPTLISALNDSSALVRREAVVEILKASPPLSEVRDPLEHVRANDRDPAVRDYAAAVLRKLEQAAGR